MKRSCVCCMPSESNDLRNRAACHSHEGNGHAGVQSGKKSRSECTCQCPGSCHGGESSLDGRRAQSKEILVAEAEPKRQLGGRLAVSASTLCMPLSARLYILIRPCVLGIEAQDVSCTYMQESALCQFWSIRRAVAYNWCRAVSDWPFHM